jgi:hypothetical protein
MTDSTQRRYPRFDCDLRAVLERRLGEGTRPDGDEAPPTRAPVTVSCLSAGGLGLAFDEWDECPVQAGEPVLVRLLIQGRELALAGDVAWIQPRPQAPFDLGVELRLERCPREVRDAYRALVRRHGGPGALARRLSPEAR